ncbi:Os12g0580400 [Oryza sativa Japonica Group]|uniref:Amino acid permease family protein, putative, expressed n=2 Tax=Oryza sativa subsp. japonica TaxID=39947 RepID=Q2QN40_ORYSJ|nr:amino acid permease family protein, putative, expressed [Oryza sativa Japonica Group]BAF30148.1 Os12g0580400 [Oryza sativa Japonica Group]|eukprot:NP_001067129.1 Os12g0580400 [Oryza sativa Japonica Group]
MTGACEAAPARRRGLTVLPLVALIFYDVSGGPFGIEDSVRAGGGALLPILGFLVLPVLWSLPEALVTAELASAFPTNAGYVAWVSAAFGPAAAFLVGFSKWASGTLDNALYPVLFLDYLRSGGGLVLSPPARSLAVLALTAALTYLNFRGLHLVGLSALALTAFSLSPFVALAVLAAPKIRPSRWLAVNVAAVEPRAYFNSMFWNLNYWDKASTLAGEVEEPRKTFPKAVFGAVGLVVGAYLIPLLAGTGALPSETAGEWTDGFFSVVGDRIGGPVAARVDPGRRGHVQHGALRGRDERRLVPAPRHGGDGHDPGDLRAQVAPRHADVQHPLLGHRRRHPLLHELPGDRRVPQLPLRPRDARRVRRLRQAPRQGPRPPPPVPDPRRRRGRRRHVRPARRPHHHRHVPRLRQDARRQRRRGRRRRRHVLRRRAHEGHRLRRVLDAGAA